MKRILLDGGRLLLVVVVAYQGLGCLPGHLLQQVLALA